MKTYINLHQMQMASTLAEHFKNTHATHKRAWHTHNRLIQKAATEIANLSFMMPRSIEWAKIWGILEGLDKKLESLR